jgi:MFS family permease
MKAQAMARDYTTPLSAETAAPATRVRWIVLAFLGSLSFVLYIDRVCISQAVLPISVDLSLSTEQMGYVLGAFTLAYGLFEVPTGRWGDRYGSRGVLTRIVLWWSAFTALTGAANGLWTLLLVRFLFGAGEAGALPNTSRTIARWFPPGARGIAQGTIVTSAQLGGAVAPTVAAALIHAIGWRLSFVAFGFLGVVWAIAFYWWYRDDPAEHSSVNESERFLIAASSNMTPGREHHPPIPWSTILRCPTVWLMGSITTCGAFAYYMYISWYPTYLQVARELEPMPAGVLASLVLAGGAIGGISGGYLSDRLVRATGDRRGTRRWLGSCAFTLAAISLLASIYCNSPVVATLFVALACLSAQVQLATWWAVMTEISGPHLGTLFGLTNSLGVVGAFSSQVFFGWLPKYLEGRGFTGRDQWDPAYYVYTAVLLVGACCWRFVDPTRSAVEPLASEDASCSA